MKLLSAAIVFLILSLSVSNSKASHMIGASITYELIDSLEYKFTVKVYRDCQGSSTWTPNAGLRCASGSGSSSSVSLKLSSIRDLTPICKDSVKPCNPLYTGPYKGIEEYTYYVTIDFKEPSYKTLLSCNPSCEIIFETGECCRSSTINTGAANESFYTFAMLNPCIISGNSSPVTSTLPAAYLCCNQPFYYGMNASDTANSDSLSFAWAHPLKARGANISYNSPYSYKRPFKFYNPSGTGYTNPNVNPPLGLYLNPETGEIIFTPTMCNEVTVAVIEIKEWRKDTSGIFRHIGTIRRDMQFWVQTCPNNNPPTVIGPYNYSACAGKELCFEIKTKDKPKTIPGQRTPDADSTKIYWNAGIPGAKFKVLNDTALNQSAEFCWTPALKDIGITHTFSVSAEDDACPYNAKSMRTFGVVVTEQPASKTTIDKLNCNQYSIESKIASNFLGTPSYHWQILDSNKIPISDLKTIFFENSRLQSSSHKQDTIQFLKGGKYIIKHSISSTNASCTTSYLDTLIVPYLGVSIVEPGTDTFLCAKTDLILNPFVANKNPAISYSWSNGDTTSSSTIQIPNNVADTVYTLSVEERNSCTSTFSITVYRRKNLVAFAGQDRRICSYDSIHLKQKDSIPMWVHPKDPTKTLVKQVDTVWKRWYRDGILISTKSKITAKIGGTYIITIDDSLGCMASDSMVLMVNDTVNAGAGANHAICANDTLYLVADGLDTVANGKSGTYTWFDLSSDAPDSIYLGMSSELFLSIKKNTDFFLDLAVTEDSVTCVDFDSIRIVVNAIPDVKIDRSVLDDSIPGHVPTPYLFCQTREAIRLYASPTGGVWGSPYPNSITGDTFKPSASPTNINFLLIYQFLDTLGCEDQDSVIIQVTGKPVISRSGDTLFSTRGFAYQWYDSTMQSIGGNREYLILRKTGKYHVEVTELCGKMASDEFDVRLLEVENVSSLNIEIYPNPVSKYFNLKIENNPGAKLCLFDVSGRCIFKSKSDLVITRVDTQNLEEGIYWLEVEIENEKGYKKILIK
jgi:hypothetical protein